MSDIAVVCRDKREFREWVFNTHGYKKENFNMSQGIYTVGKTRFIGLDIKTNLEIMGCFVFHDILILNGGARADELIEAVKRRIIKRR